MSLVKSMTGYGRAVETVNGREFTVELRSVNNRYLDCTVKLPRPVLWEDAVKQAVKNAISRGKGGRVPVRPLRGCRRRKGHPE